MQLILGNSRIFNIVITICAYQKAGFVVEGRSRQELNRNGRRWDVLYMGILRAEWQNRVDKILVMEEKAWPDKLGQA